MLDLIQTNTKIQLCGQGPFTYALGVKSPITIHPCYGNCCLFLFRVMGVAEVCCNLESSVILVCMSLGCGSAWRKPTRRENMQIALIAMDQETERDHLHQP